MLCGKAVACKGCGKLIGKGPWIRSKGERGVRSDCCVPSLPAYRGAGPNNTPLAGGA